MGLERPALGRFGAAEFRVSLRLPLVGDLMRDRAERCTVARPRLLRAGGRVVFAPGAGTAWGSGTTEWAKPGVERGPSFWSPVDTLWKSSVTWAWLRIGRKCVASISIRKPVANIITGRRILSRS